MTPPDQPGLRTGISRRRLLLTSGAGVIGFGLTRSTSGSDDDYDDHDKQDDRHDRDRDDDEIRPLGTVPAGSGEVVIDDDDADGFKPGTITIYVGQSVTWVNLDDDPHTATGADFDTGILEPGELATISFEEPGTFPYSCQIHPIMTGTVEVRDESGAVPVTSVAEGTATPGASPAASPHAVASSEVDIDNLKFAPADLTVPVGTTVVWTNREVIPHTVRSTSEAFDSGIMEQGDVFEFTFESEGVFDYICGLHPSMEGRVTVEG